MNRVLLISASMLAVSLLASPKLPSAKIRVAISKAIHAKDVNAFAAVLAEHGLDVNSVLMSGGYTVLHEVAVQGSPEIVEYLIAQDADVNIVNEYGYTPLDEAIAFGDADTVALLEEAGATHGEGFRIGVAPTSHVLRSHSVALLPRGSYHESVRGRSYYDHESGETIDGGTWFRFIFEK